MQLFAKKTRGGINPKGPKWFFWIFAGGLMTAVPLSLTYLIQLISQTILSRDQSSLSFIILVLVATSLVGIFCRFFYSFARKKFLLHWNEDIRNSLMQSILLRPYENFQLKDRAYYISLFNNDLSFLQEHWIHPKVELFSSCVTLLASTIYSLTIHLPLTIIILVIGVITTFAVSYLSRIPSKFNRIALDTLGDYNQFIDDPIKGFLALFLSNREKEYLDFFKKTTRKAMNNQVQALFVSGLMNSLINQASFLTQSIIFVTIAGFIFYGKIEPYFFPVFLSLTNTMISPIFSIASSISEIKGSTDTLKKIRSEINIANDQFDTCKGSRSLGVNQCIFKDVSFSYDEKMILQNINLVINKNEHILIRGESGSGKSTLLKLMTNQLRSYSGEILINNREIRSVSRDSIAFSISMVTQQSIIFRESLLGNITLFEDPSKVNSERLKYSIKQAGLEKFVEALPYGLDTLAMDAGCNLSGGEQQRIDLARALYQNPEILLVDEITSGLDYSTACHIEKIISQLHCIVIAISHRHDVDVEGYYHTCYTLKDGKLKKEGP